MNDKSKQTERRLLIKQLLRLGKRGMQGNFLRFECNATRLKRLEESDGERSVAI